MTTINAKPESKGGAGPVFLIPDGTYNTVVAKAVEGNQVDLPHHGWAVCYVHLHVSAAATEVDDTLDIWIDWMSGHGDWINVIKFPQVLGNGGVKHFIATVPKTAGLAAAVTDVSADLTNAGARSLLLGKSIRARVTRVDGGGAAMSFDYHIDLTWKI